MRQDSMVIAALALVFTAAAGAQVRYSHRPPPPPPQYQAPYPGPPNRPGYGNQVISCGSPDYHFLRCPVPRGWRGVRIVRQTSESACVEGRTWGFDRGSIWVDNGCAGEFAAAGGWRPGPGWNRDFIVSCGSPQYRYHFCQVDVGRRGRVLMRRQTSDSACIQGRTWGWNRAGIWVDKGCGAQFLVTRRW